MKEQAEQNWVPCLKQISLKIESCFALKCLKYTCNKGILSIQIMGKCVFVHFRNFFPFNWKAKLVIYLLLLLLFCLTKQLRYATYGLEICCSYLGSIKHTYISWLSKLFPHRTECNLFPFSFCLMWHNIEL